MTTPDRTYVERRLAEIRRRAPVVPLAKPVPQRVR